MFGRRSGDDLNAELRKQLLRPRAHAAGDNSGSAFFMEPFREQSGFMRRWTATPALLSAANAFGPQCPVIRAEHPALTTVAADCIHAPCAVIAIFIILHVRNLMQRYVAQMQCNPFISINSIDLFPSASCDYYIVPFLP
jgi:hypothetical protein